MKPWDTNKAKSISNKVFDVESGIALLQFRDATGKTVKMSMKVHSINSPEKVAAKHEVIKIFSKGLQLTVFGRV